MVFSDANRRKAVGEVRIGVDAGSKTVKAVALDERDVVIGSLYQRHNLDVRATVAKAIETLALTCNITEARVAFTGSAAIDLAEQMDIPFVQEVIATTDAVNKLIPSADVVIELGGEDTKIIYLTGPEGVEQRMNATCAGGTGSFIETAAHMVGVHTDEVSKLALGAQYIYPIASRCAVFAQNDIRPLMNAGVSKADIAASALEAVARQAVGGLACGRPIRGNVVLLGGVIELIPAARLAFTRVLKDMDARIVIPRQAHLVTAHGCAMAARDSKMFDLEELEWHLRKSIKLKDDLKRLPPLFDDEAQRADFEARHADEHVRRGNFADAEGEVFIGLDAGSTTVKCAVVDAAGNLLFSDYVEAEGDTLEIAREMVLKARRVILSKKTDGLQLRVGRAVVTGYGEDLLKCGLGFDAGVVETAAHLRAALELRPDATFVLDIGGQDMKALWVRDGVVVDAVLNEACSSGCGAFIGGSARSLKTTKDRFNKLALEAENPIDLGTKCTVFMTSRVRHAQKIGASVEDIAAGIAYSVVNNALLRIIGEGRASTMGNVAVVQGGTFKSDAVLRAFEKVSGCTVIRPDIAHLMGAYGAALLARDEWARMGESEPNEAAKSSLIGIDELERLNPERRHVRCGGCGNNCRVAIVDFGGGRRFASGNQCDKVFVSPGGLTHAERELIPNTAQAERDLLSRYVTVESGKERGEVKIGLLNALDSYEHTPFWHTLLLKLGFSVFMPEDARYAPLASLAAETVPSESVCSPAKVAHQRYQGLVFDGCDFVFMPRYARGRHCAVSTGYASALLDNVGSDKLAAPLLPCPSLRKLAHDAPARDALFAEMARLSGQVAPLTREDYDAALQEAFDEQAAFEAKVREAGDAALAWLAEDRNRHAVALACRPYHIDEAILHGVDEMLQKLGFAVIVPLGIDASNSGDPHGSWDIARGLRKALAFSDANERVDVVAIRSFGCGYDAAAFSDVRRGHSFTELKIDDMVDTAHIRIRLRTLAETRGIRIGGEGSSAHSVGAAMPLAIPDACSTLRELLSRSAAGEPVPETCVKCLTFYAEREAGVGDEPLPGASSQKPSVVSSGGPLSRLSLLVKRMVGGAVKRQAGEVSDGGEADGRSRKGLRVGLVGNPLLVFDATMNEGIADMLESFGCDVAMPQRDLVFVDDVRYLDQLDRFSREGVDLVIYLQSFGCLKGHVQSRGAAHELAKRYPNMPITIVDYDPDSSALNRENRIRLAVEAAKRRKALGAEMPLITRPASLDDVSSLEEALLWHAGIKHAEDLAKAEDEGNAKVHYDMIHRRVVSLVPLEDLGGQNRQLVDYLIGEGYSFEVDSSPRMEAKRRESLRR